VHASLTTSWDDGDPLDLRVADLLAKHHLQGTFYVPLEPVRGRRLTTAQLRELGSHYEVGSHTVHEVRLTTLDDQTARREVHDSKIMLEDILQRPVEMFCPVAGRFGPRDLRLIQEAGYLGLRTVELLSTDRPLRHGQIEILATSIQAYPHSPIGYIRNLAKRGRYTRVASSAVFLHDDWTRLAFRLLERAVQQGGVFHLWGHSWEIEERQQWQALDDVLGLMADYRGTADPVRNSQLCGRSARQAA
jgi:peptidoglycan-N-acetylglucosamine deacetylase